MEEALITFKSELQRLNDKYTFLKYPLKFYNKNDGIYREHRQHYADRDLSYKELVISFICQESDDLEKMRLHKNFLSARVNDTQFYIPDRLINTLWETKNATTSQDIHLLKNLLQIGFYLLFDQIENICKYCHDPDRIMSIYRCLTDRDAPRLNIINMFLLLIANDRLSILQTIVRDKIVPETPGGSDLLQYSIKQSADVEIHKFIIGFQDYKPRYQDLECAIEHNRTATVNLIISLLDQGLNDYSVCSMWSKIFDQNRNQIPSDIIKALLSTFPLKLDSCNLKITASSRLKYRAYLRYADKLVIQLIKTFQSHKIPDHVYRQILAKAELTRGC